MGKKILQAGNMVAGFAVLGYVVCLFLPLHKSHYTTLKIFPVVDITTYSLTNYYNWRSKLACGFVRRLRGGPQDMCGDEGGTSVWLQDTQATFCQDGIDTIFQSACGGFQSAYLLGVCMFLVVLMNAIAQGITFWLIQQYMQKPKKQYREVAFFLDLIGTILMLIVVLVYVLALQRLSSVTTLGIDIFVDTANGIGASYGYFFLYFFIVIQGISVVLLASGSNSQEAREAEMREQRKFMQEMAMFEQATEMVNTNFGPQGVMAPPANWQSPPANWGNQQMQPPMQPAYGGPPMPAMTQPYAQPHMGMQPQMGGAGPYF